MIRNKKHPLLILLITLCHLDNFSALCVQDHCIKIYLPQNVLNSSKQSEKMYQMCGAYEF